MAKHKGKGRFYYRAQFEQGDTGVCVLPDGAGRISGSVPAWHRINVADSSPYCIQNELICARIGRVLGLPIPPYSITYFNQQPYFSSLNFDPDERGKQPAIVPEICAERFPWLCTGILFFDILVANEDRHDENLAVDDVGNPRTLVVYDHEQALFGGGGNLCGVERLKTLRDRLGITGSTVTGGNECCLLKSLKTVKFFTEWRNRLWDIPEWFVNETCDAAIEIGLSQPEANAAKDFLLYRKNNVTKIIRSNAKSIPLVDEWRPQNALFGPQ